MDVVEIDPGMTELAKIHFGLEPDPRLRIFHVDGRAFLNRIPEAGYDAVFVDAFNSLFSIPFQLTTVEAVRKIENALAPDGVVLLNLASAVRGEGAAFLESETATYRAIFEHVELFRVTPEKDPAHIQNIILVASQRPLETESGIAKVDALLSNRIVAGIENRRVMTDDLAPVERFLSIAHSSSN